MPKVSTLQTNFTSGELSPKVQGRFDIARYQNGARRLRNVLVNIYGGAERTPGTEFMVSAKYPNAQARLIPFIFSRDAAYHLEFGDGYMRVVRAGAGQILVGGNPYEIGSPYSADDVRELTYVQAADTMFIAHEDHPLYTLRRMADDSWLLEPAPMSVVPFAEVGATQSIGLTISDPAIGTGRTFTAAADAFYNSDVGRRITFGGGTAFIRGFTSRTVVTGDVVSAFPTGSIPNSWVIEDSPQAPLKPSSKGVVGQTIDLEFEQTPTAFEGWRGDEVGQYIRINRGLVLINRLDSSSKVAGVVKQDLDSDVAAPASAWSLERSVWNSGFGYPRAVTLNEQRLVVGGTRKYPQGIWGSRTGLYYDFTPGDNDSDGFFFNVYSEQVNLIEHLASMQAVVPLTYGGEFTVTGGIEKPLAPTNVSVKSQSVYGCNRVRPVRIGNELLFVQRSGRKVRSMAYRVESDSYAAPDLTTLAEHLTETGIVAMAYQQEPQPILWCVRADGKLSTLTIDRDEGVTAWTSQDTDGFFEDVCVAPAGERDEVLAIVRRVINGVTRRYIERFNPGYYVQCGIQGTSAEGSAVWAGLSHIEGKTVDVLADGATMDQVVVTGGQITLPRNANTVQIGLHVEPEIELLRPEVGTQTGTSQGNAKRTHEIKVLFLNTVGATINDKEVPWREFGSDILDRNPDPFSGYKSINDSGWSRDDNKINIKQTQPLPFHVLAVVRKWTTNDG